MKTNEKADINAGWQPNGKVKPAHINALTGSIQYDYVITDRMLENKSGEVSVNDLFQPGAISGRSGEFHVLVNSVVPATITLIFDAGNAGGQDPLNVHVHCIAAFKGKVTGSDDHVTYYFHTHGTANPVTLYGVGKHTYVGSFSTGASITLASGATFVYENALNGVSAITGTITQSLWMTNASLRIKPDWNAAAGSDAEILNKPTIPTVNNGTLTIRKNGSNVATFSANQSAAATANIEVPTKTSELNNDADFITGSDLYSALNGGATVIATGVKSGSDLDMALGGKQTTLPYADGKYSISISGSSGTTGRADQVSLKNGTSGTNGYYEIFAGVNESNVPTVLLASTTGGVTSITSLSPSGITTDGPLAVNGDIACNGNVVATDVKNDSNLAILIASKQNNLPYDSNTAKYGINISGTADYTNINNIDYITTGSWNSYLPNDNNKASFINVNQDTGLVTDGPGKGPFFALTLRGSSANYAAQLAFGQDGRNAIFFRQKASETGWANWQLLNNGVLKKAFWYTLNSDHSSFIKTVGPYYTSSTGMFPYTIEVTFTRDSTAQNLTLGLNVRHGANNWMLDGRCKSVTSVTRRALQSDEAKPDIDSKDVSFSNLSSAQTFAEASVAPSNTSTYNGRIECQAIMVSAVSPYIGRTMALNVVCAYERRPLVSSDAGTGIELFGYIELVDPQDL